MHDVLSEVLDTLELESTLYFRAELSSPFSVAVPENRNVVRFHIAGEGRCSITVDGGENVHFEPGDLVMVPHGRAHILSDACGAPVTSLAEVVDETGFDGDGPLVYGGGGERTTLVCGHFGFSSAVTHPFLETLPNLLHLRRAEGPDYTWVAQLLAFTEQESRIQAKGWQGVVERLSQILFIYVLRAHLEQHQESAGAIAALRDPQLAVALEAVHSSPATGWTLDTLAQKARMSRSAFVRKFNAICGMSPMRYLTYWRMTRARHLLAQTETSAGEVAALVGYASEAAFNRAFREHFDQPPASFRKYTRALVEKLDGKLR